MPSGQGFVSGAGGGAGVGMALGGPVGAGIGAFLGGLIGGFSGEDPEEVRQKRLREAAKKISENYKAEMTLGIERLGKSIKEQVAFARTAAKHRASAAGVENSESYVLPAENAVAQEGSRTIGRFADNLTTETGRSLNQLAMAGLNAPVNPGFGKSILAIGEGAMTYKLNQDYLKILKDQTQFSREQGALPTPNTPPSAVLPSTPGAPMGENDWMTPPAPPAWTDQGQWDTGTNPIGWGG